MADKQDANFVGLFKAREETLGVLPANPVFYTREPNSFDDMGGEYTKVARKPFSPSRQRKMGSVTDLDATGGYNEDLTQNNMKMDLEEFFFAALRKTAESTNVAATAATDDYTVDSTADMIVGNILYATGFDLAANNGIHVVNGITDATHVSTADSLTDEAAAVKQKVKVVGHEFAVGDLEMTAAVGGTFLLTTTVQDLTVLGLIEGQWIGIGGAAANKFATVPVGYARIALAGITTNAIAFDKSTFTPATDDGATKLIRIWYGDRVKNEDDPDLIVRYSSLLERTLGRDNDGRQSEQLVGCVANELKWNSPLANLVNVDLGYIAQRATTRTGLEAPLSEGGTATIVAALGESAFNTSANVYRMRLSLVDPTTLNPTPYFARATEWDATVNNNVTSAKAQGVLGGFDTIVGNFDVDMTIQGYFSTVEAIHAVKCNYDSTFDAIYTKGNAGIVIDFPLLGLGGGKLNIDQDAAIMIPLENAAAESPFGHTLMVEWFDYLPTELLADTDC